MNKIPFVDLKAQYLSIKEDIDTAISSVINETAFIGGKYVDEFEKKFAELYGVDHCVPVANGTDAIYIILRILGVGLGDEVITVSNSWISTSETISQTGARPIFVDIDPNYYSIDESKIEEKINSKTKVIIPVHFHGQPCNMDPIMSLAKKYNLYVVEDCAQAHFTEFNGQRVGTFGIASTFSFFPGKNLGAYGDAGCILTNSQSHAIQFKMFARHGALVKHDHKIEGINSRLDGLQASILLAKLPYILGWTEMRISRAFLYFERLKNVKEIKLPLIRSGAKHSFHLFVIRAQNRDNLAQFLKLNNIETFIHYPKILPRQVAYRYLEHDIPLEFPISDHYSSEILSLPIYPELTNEMVEYICDKIKEFYLL